MRCIIVRAGDGGLRPEIEVGSQRLVVSSSSGDGKRADVELSPYDLLLAALGTCTTITLHRYAQRHGWPLRWVEVRLEHKRQHHLDSEACAERDIWLERIEKFVELGGSLSQEQRERLLRVADRCPVQRTLLGQVAILSAQSLECDEERIVPRD